MNADEVANALGIVPEVVATALETPIFGLCSTLIGKARHVHTTGVGKSRYAAERLAAALCTIQVSASFLHPLEALHGELGAVRDNDLIILVSASGETQELIEVVRHVAERGGRTLLLSTTEGSPLQQSCNDALVVPFPPSIESPLLPVVASAILGMIGDLLCLKAAEFRGVTPNDVSVGHPGGTFFAARELLASERHESRIAQHRTGARGAGPCHSRFEGG